MALIEKEPIMNFIQDGLNNKLYGHVGVEIITEVEYAPIIDAVSVVRCKDCTWYNHGYCMSFNDDVMPNGFCSRGHIET